MRTAVIVVILILNAMPAAFAESGAAALLGDLLGGPNRGVANDDARAECEGFLLRLEDGADLENKQAQRLFGICGILDQNRVLGNLQFDERSKIALGENHSKFQESGNQATIRGADGDPITVAQASETLTQVQTISVSESDFAKPAQIALLSTAGALIVSSGALAIAWAFAEERRLGVEGAENSTYSERQDAANHANTMGNAAIITGSVGVAMAAGTLAWMFLDDTARDDPQALASRTIGPIVGPDQVGFGIDVLALFGGN